MTKPIVAIVGRPNVGKSTLFNRLLGERRAITEELPGTTRDRVYADIPWGQHKLTLVDSGGLEFEPSSDIGQRVRGQVEIAIDEADSIIFLVDSGDGVTISDQEIAEALRRAGKSVILAVNKCDNAERRNQAVQFYELGMGEPLAISAYHDIGIGELMERVVASLPLLAVEVEEPVGLKIAIVGRPNVGKSMLVNAILGQERVIVDEVPGTTRDAIDVVFRYDGDSMLLIDTAGIRKRGRVDGGIERYSVLRGLHAIDRADVALLITDAGEGMTAQDAHIAGYVQQALKGMVLVVNKWDLAPQLGKNMAQCTEEIRQRLKFLPQVPILFASAKFGQGIEKVLTEARGVYQERLKWLAAPLLKEAVDQALAAHTPPSARGKRLSILGASQTGVNPPTFVFLVNNPKLLHFSYRRYLENQLREHFGFAGTPLRLIFKRRGER